MQKLYIHFNPDFNTVHELKHIARAMRDLLRAANDLEVSPERFFDSFQMLTNNMTHEEPKS